jgi:hypothetical protein
LLKKLKVDAWLIGRAKEGVVERILIFSSIGKIGIEGHRSVRREEVSAIVEVWHHAILLGESRMIDEHVLVEALHCNVVLISFYNRIDARITLININNFSLFSSCSSDNFNIIISSSPTPCLV